MAWADLRWGAWRGVLVTLAALALVTRIAIPQGFMLSGSTSQIGPQLVICTGHGPLKANQPAAPADKSKPDSPCAFAGHGCAAAPHAAPLVETAAFARTAESRPIPAGLTPGRGLAAPPPPALGPPLSI